MVKESDIILTWMQPEKLKRYKDKKLLQDGKAAIPRVLLIVVVLLITEYLFLKDLYPPEEQDNLLKLIGMSFLCAIAFALFGFILLPFLQRFSKVVYKFTYKDVRIEGERRWTKTWEDLDGYSLSNHDKVPDIKVLTLYHNKGKMHLYLPDDINNQGIIIAVIKERIPEMEAAEPFERVELTSRQYYFLMIFSLIYSLAISFLFVGFVSNSLFVFAFIVPLFLGPGTIGVLVLYGHRTKKKKELWAYAYAFNVLSSCLIMLFSSLVAITNF